MSDVHIGFAPAQGPDGKTWGVMSVLSGAVNTQVAFPQEMLEGLSEKLPAELSKLLAEVKRANLGLVTALTLPKGMQK